MAEKDSSKRIFYFDLLNIVACIAVIALHCNGIVHMYSEARCWKTSLIVETVAYWAVPVFFMLTGATLMDYRKRYSTKEFFIKRFTKTGIPFVAWSMFFLVLNIHAGYVQIESLSFKEVVDMMLNCEILSIYWFFPALYSVYFAIPVIAAIPEKSRKRIYNYIIVYGLCVISILPVVFTVSGMKFNGDLSPAICGGYLLYVIIGYQLTKTNLTRRIRLLIYVCGAGGWLLRFLTTLLISQEIGEIYRGFWGYTAFPTVALAVAVFVWFQYHDWNWLAKRKRVVQWIGKISGASFGIYLIHWFFIWKLPEHLGINVSSWHWRTFGILLVYFLSLICILVLKKIPVVKRLVP